MMDIFIDVMRVIMNYLRLKDPSHQFHLTPLSFYSLKDFIIIELLVLKIIYLTNSYRKILYLNPSILRQQLHFHTLVQCALSLSSFFFFLVIITKDLLFQISFTPPHQSYLFGSWCPLRIIHDQNCGNDYHRSLIHLFGVHSNEKLSMVKIQYSNGQ